MESNERYLISGSILRAYRFNWNPSQKSKYDSDEAQHAPYASFYGIIFTLSMEKASLIFASNGFSCKNKRLLSLSIHASRTYRNYLLPDEPRWNISCREIRALLLELNACLRRRTSNSILQLARVTKDILQLFECDGTRSHFSTDEL